MNHRRGRPWALVMLAFVGAFTAPPAEAASPAAVESNQFMVVSAQHLAAEAGAEILRAGGNAIDAAVAMGYAEAVTNPCCGNIGGGGFLVARLADGRDLFINFRETAPANATRTMFLDQAGSVVPGASLRGWRASGVPGTVMGLDSALTDFGSMARGKVMEPAIRLARDGFVLTQGDADIFSHFASTLRRNPVAAKTFLHPDGSPLVAGERLTQPDLARTLAAIAEKGPDAFYKGEPARAIAGASAGALTEADFSAYRVTTGVPLRCSYRGRTILSAPPPSSGGVTLCEILGVLEGYNIGAQGFHSAEAVHRMTEAMRHAFIDRNTYLGDPAFTTNPLDGLLGAAHLAAIRAAITDRATPSSGFTAGAPPHERPQTTHYSVIDHTGNAVAVTYTLNGAFGSGEMAEGTGVLMNNEMDDFTILPGTPNGFGLVQGEANRIEPGKRPLSSMTPTIVLQDGRVSMVLGSPGGPRIITIVLETIMNMIDHGMSAGEAVAAPRIHHQWLPDALYAERFALSPDTRDVLHAMGYTIVDQTNWGAAALIAVGPATTSGSAAGNVSDPALSGHMRPNLFYGAIDPRRPAGAAIGR
jgi:gamma-glutamyltranspeptidase / glutathione hydrolase